MSDERIERIFRRVVNMAGRAVDRYRAVATRTLPRPVKELLQGLTDEARRRAAETERAYFLVVGRPALDIPRDEDRGLEMAVSTNRTDLLRTTLDEFRRFHGVIQDASRQVPPGLPRRTMVGLVQAEQGRITAFTEIYRGSLVTGKVEA